MNIKLDESIYSQLFLTYPNKYYTGTSKIVYLSNGCTRGSSYDILLVDSFMEKENGVLRFTGIPIEFYISSDYYSCRLENNMQQYVYSEDVEQIAEKAILTKNAIIEGEICNNWFFDLLVQFGIISKIPQRFYQPLKGVEFNYKGYILKESLQNKPITISFQGYTLIDERISSEQ
jgi:hypothetical protein